MVKHKHHILKKEDVIGGYWKLHRLFRNPKVKQVLLACEICFPKKKVTEKKIGRIQDLDGEK
jgi:hypothetical protein